MNYTFFFILFNIFSSILVISSSSWWVMWICLELNSFFFVPWMMETKTPMMSSKSFVYFLIQTLASFIFLFCSLLMFNSSFVSSLSMMIKLGAFPFHFWVLDVVEMMDWDKFFFFSSVMKISPWLVLLLFCPVQWSLFFILPFSILIALGGFSIWSLRLILAYSSIVHVSWLILSCCLSQSLSIFYFTSYIFSIYIMINLLKKKNINSLKELSKIMVLESNLYLVYFYVVILSFLGIPPFLGFYMKFFLLKSMIYQKLFIEALLIIILSIFPIYLYLKVFFISFIFMKAENLDFCLNLKGKIGFFSFFMFIFLTLSLWMW